MGIPLRRKNVPSPLCSRPANFHPNPCRASCTGPLTIITASRIRPVRSSSTGLILLAVIIVSVPLHEALHGFGWKLAGRLHKGDVTFFLRSGIPMCACRTILSTKAYLIGTLLPFFILGGGSFLFLFLCPGTISVLTALVNLMLPGADLAISWRVLRSEAALIADNPEGAGFIGLVKNQE